MKTRMRTCVTIFFIGWFVAVMDSHAQDTSEDRCGSIPDLMNKFTVIREAFDVLQSGHSVEDDTRTQATRLVKRCGDLLAQKKCYLAQIDNIKEALANPETMSMLPTLREQRDHLQSIMEELPEDFPKQGRDTLKSPVQLLNLAILKQKDQRDDDNKEALIELFTYVSLTVNSLFTNLEIAAVQLKTEILGKEVKEVVDDIDDIIRNHQKWEASILPFLTDRSSLPQLESISINPLAYRLKQLLGRDLAPHNRNPDGWTDLHYAAVLNLPQDTKHLLEQGAPVNAHLLTDGETCSDQLWSRLNQIDRNLGDWMKRLGQTPLHVAARFNSREVAVELIHAGASLQAQSINGTTPLHYAARGDSYEIAKLLTAKGARVDSSAKDGQTPLHYAAWYGSVTVVGVLIENGANLNAQDADGITPLHYAALYKHLMIADRLVKAGADVYVKNKDGHTPLHYAEHSGARGIVELLRNPKGTRL